MPRNERGTLYELYLIPVALGIMLTIAIPQFRHGWRRGVAALIVMPLALAAICVVLWGASNVVFWAESKEFGQFQRARAWLETAVMFLWYSFLCFVLLALGVAALLHILPPCPVAVEGAMFWSSLGLALAVGALIASKRVKGLEYALISVLILALTFALLMSVSVLVVALSTGGSSLGPLAVAAVVSVVGSFLLVRRMRPIFEPREQTT